MIIQIENKDHIHKETKMNKKSQFSTSVFRRKGGNASAEYVVITEGYRTDIRPYSRYEEM